MHIVYVIHDTNALSGASKALVNIIGKLRETGNKATVVVPDNNGIANIFREMGVTCIDVPFRNGVYPPLKNIRNYLYFIPKLFLWRYYNHKAIARISGMLKNEKVDIIHSNSSAIDVGYKVAKSLGCSHLYHIREYVNDYIGVSYYPKNSTFYKRIQAKDKYSYSACIIPDLQKLFSLENSRYSRVVYDGVLPKHKELLHPAKKGYLLYVGRIERQKGLLPLIEGYIEYLKESKKKMPLKVLGSINQLDYYNQVVKALKDNDSLQYVEFCGMQEDVISYLKGADGLVVSSLTEGFGFCMAEAMFNECPVIGYDVSGTHQQFENGLRITGSEIGYRYTNSLELKNALLRLESKDNSKMVENAWKTVNTLYTSENNFESVYSFYKYIIDCEK